jgi:hypothetical protein
MVADNAAKSCADLFISHMTSLLHVSSSSSSSLGATALREPWLPVLFASTGLYPELSFSIHTPACKACLNRIIWSKDIRKERKLNIYKALIKSRLLCVSETWRLTENNKRWVEATEMDGLRRSSRI